MTSIPWLYCPTLADEGDQVVLSPAESQHLVGSHRRRVGDSLILFDGNGLVTQARVQALDRRPVSGIVKIIAREKFVAPVRSVHLASALPKGERQGLLLDFATQFGMTDFIPLDCKRSIARASTGGYRRWQRTLVESCKQSHRPWLPKLHPACRPLELLSRWQLPDKIVLLADSQGKLPGELDEKISTIGNLLLMVGPEGGFSSDERNGLLELGVHPVCLADTNLRIEAAAIALVAAVWCWQIAG